MSTTDFVSPIWDISFSLFEHIRIQDLPNTEYTDFDMEMYKMVLAEAAKLAEETLAPLNAAGDREGCHWKDGRVHTPKGYKQAYKKYVEGGWQGLSIEAEHGGGGLPKPMALAVVELFTGACASFIMYPGLTVAVANLITSMGSPWVRATLLPKLISGQWAGTMCLTEPQAGSAVGDVRTTARRKGDHYLIEGNKIFISSGDHDLTENILHVMLARLPDAPPGIKGLSLFLVPKVWINEDGSLAEPNDVHCTGIEHKMGLNGSSTCTLSIGDNGGAKAWLIGNEGEGILRMFSLMNEARIGVGVQSYAVASAAYHAALSYARERIQGTRISEFKNAEAERIPIIEHPDVKRMLLHCRSQVSAMRALGLSLGKFADLHVAHQGSPEGQRYMDYLEVLTPICKSWSSDQCFEVASWALQIFGGYGYIGEYPAEQYVRDSKVFSIYEGTNGIQALDLIGRKMSQHGGRSFMATMELLNSSINKLGEVEEFASEHKALAQARDRLGSAAMKMMGLGMAKKVDAAAAHACNLLNLLGDVVMAVMLADQALIARDALAQLAAQAGIDLGDSESRSSWLEEHGKARFYISKLDDLRYFCHQFLPRTAALEMMISSADSSVLDCSF
ncbi:MAG: acyl-CoA dehydrogenase [Rickettsiales bacterium]|nr:acyl-CoA dehydrogenase [Rickettsiales bacterium]